MIFMMQVVWKLGKRSNEHRRCKSLKLVDFLLGGVGGDAEAVAVFPTCGCQCKQPGINSQEELSFSVAMGWRKPSSLLGLCVVFSVPIRWAGGVDSNLSYCWLSCLTANMGLISGGLV